MARGAPDDKIAVVEPTAHVLAIRVRYGETDQMGIVHHANYLLYAEEGRTSLMRDRGCSYAELEKRGFGLPVRRAELRFRSPALYEDELVVRTRVGRLGAASVVFESRIERAGDATHLADVTIELACVDLRGATRKPVMLPDDVRALLERP